MQQQMPWGHSWMEGAFVTKFSFFRWLTFVKPRPRLGIPLSVHLCELGTCPKWGMKSCQIPLSIESCQLRSETLLLYVGHWRPMLTSTVCDLAWAAEFMKKLVVRGKEICL